MKFGISLFPTVGPAEQSGTDYFAGALELAALADELGYHHVKTVEHHFFGYGGYSPDPITFLAAAAARTSRVRLVTGAVIPAFTHPVKLAAQLAMLDNLSHGRLDAGFGRAFLPDEFDAFGISMDDSRALFEEGVDACRALWSGDQVTFDGRFHQFGPVRSLPLTYQRPHPPILVATSITPDSCAAAGRAGYGLMLVPSINKRERTQQMLEIYRDARRDAGHAGPGEVHMSYNCYVAEDPALARQNARRYSAQTNAKMIEAVSGWSGRASSNYRGYEQIVDRVRHSDFDKALRDNKALVGNPDEVVERIRTIREWFGDVTLSLQVTSGNVPLAEAHRTMSLFAQAVFPAFATAEAAAAR